MACSAEQRGLEWSSHVNLEDDRRAFPQGDVGNDAAEAAPASYEAVVLWVGISRVVAMQHVGTLPGVELKAKQRGAALGAAARRTALRDAQLRGDILLGRSAPNVADRGWTAQLVRTTRDIR